MSIPRINVPIGYKCPECPAVKYSEDEMEAHLTWEHLKYQPFECIQCGERRPTEHLIEEHMWASHQKFNEKVYYIPNKQARQRLRELMKQAFTNAYASVSSPEASAPSINPPKTLPTQTLPTQLLTPFQLNAAAFRFPLQNLTQIFTPQAQQLAMLQQLSVSSQSSRGTSSAAPTSILKRPSSTSKQESETPNKRPTKHEVVVEKSNSAPRHMNLSNEKELTQKTPASSGRQNPKSEAMNCQICKTPLIVHSCGGHVEVHLSKVFKIHLFTCGFDGCTYGHYARRKITAHMIEVHKDKNEAKVIKNMSRKYYRRWKECLFKCCPSKEIAESIVEKREAYLRQIGREDCLEDEPEFEGNVEQNDDEKDDDTKSNGSNEDDESSGQEEET